MPGFRVVAISEAVARRVRATRRSPFADHPTHTDLATGYGPCRVCLRTFNVGIDRRILFTFDPFAGREALPLPGPVFIHEADCRRYQDDGRFPDQLRAVSLTLNAYARGRQLRAQEYVADGGVETIVERLFASDDVAYIHVRDSSAGCYDFTLERVLAEPSM